MKINSALFGFVKREGFYKLVLTAKPSKLEFPETDLPLAIYVPYRAGKAPIELEQWLSEQGFERTIKLEKYTCRGELCSPVCDDLGLATGGLTPPLQKIAVKPTTGEHGSPLQTLTADEVYSFLFQHFTATEMDLPPREEFNADNAYCVRADAGNLLGVLYDMEHTRVLAISLEARGLGVGGKLYRAFAEWSGLRQFVEWIRPDNAASIAMFRKLGFEKDTLVTDCWVKI